MFQKINLLKNYLKTNKMRILANKILKSYPKLFDKIL